jgi:hypothetical protein
VPDDLTRFGSLNLPGARVASLEGHGRNRLQE